MAETTCCFGCFNARTGVAVISIINCIICVIGMMDVLSLIHFSTIVKITNSPCDETEHEKYSQLQNDFVIFIQLIVIFLLFCTNLNLYKSTRIRNIQSIDHWLETVSVIFVFFGLFICYVSIKYDEDFFMPIGIPISFILTYQMYVVKRFYYFEVEFVAASERNVVIQPTLHGPTYVALPSQTVQNPTFPVQSGPYVIQQPLTQSYPQLTYQYQPQQPSQSHIVFPVPDQHAARENTYPPPYSPNNNI